MGKSENQEVHEREDFWTKESESHYVRKKELTEDDYVKTHFHNLPAHDESYYKALGRDRLYTYQENCRLLSIEPMMNLTNMLNSEVRLKYGTAQLDLIESYENNYNQYVKNLLNWATGLYELNQKQEASDILREAISIGSDVSHVYLLMGKIYAETDQQVALLKLIAHVENSHYALRNKILEGLNTSLSTMNTEN